MDVQIRGARDNNLDDLSLSFATGQLIAFCGPSGSGKSSLAFDTLHREGQRRYLEALLQRTGTLRRPDVEGIDGLPPTIGLDQRERAAAGSTTVAGICELEVGLAVLFGRTGTAHCPGCGRAIEPMSHDRIVERLLRLPEGTRLTLEAPVRPGPGVLDEIQRAGFSRVRLEGEVLRLEAVGDVSAEQDLRIVVDRIKTAPGKRSRLHDGVRLTSRAGRGVVVAAHAGAEETFVDRPLCTLHGELPHNEPGRFRLFADQARWGLDPAAQEVTVGGTRLPAILEGTVADLGAMLEGWPRDERSEGVLDDLAHRVEVLERLGLGHLVLGSPAGRASRGEQVRLRLARQVSSRVSGVLYVLDEPASGLDDQAAAAVVAVLEELVAQGNTVLAVDHHPTLLRAATTVVEFGPGAGPDGGRIVYQGPPADLPDTPTGRVLRGELVTPRWPGGTTGTRSLGGTLVDSPGVTVLAGPSGAGKSRLLERIRAAGVDVFEKVVSAEAASIARSRRSSPATYLGIWNVLRDLLAQTREAKVQGLSSSTFSLNTKGGRCETCAGEGEIRTVLDPLPDVWTRCPVCRGRRFQADVLQVRWKGHAPDELLALPVVEAHPLLAGNPKLERGLRALRDTGLGHIQLGRRADTLSGGEVRRMKLARELARARGPALVLADDPSLGLHPIDTVALMAAFHRLAEEGSTVVLASSDPYVIQAASRVQPISG